MDSWATHIAIIAIGTMYVFSVCCLYFALAHLRRGALDAGMMISIVGILVLLQAGQMSNHLILVETQQMITTAHPAPEVAEEAKNDD